jgi:hypothetical protein
MSQAVQDFTQKVGFEANKKWLVLGFGEAPNRARWHVYDL